MAGKALKAVLAHHWAITPEYMEILASVAEREHEYSGDLQALEARLGRPLGNTMRATVRDGVAIIPIEGPLFAKANLFTEMSGATAYEILARDFTEAVNNPNVQAILLNISSPGGEVEGASEMASLISQAAAQTDKKIWSFVSGTMASAALWIGTAAQRVVAADTAIVGSIGVMAGYTVKDAKPGEKSYRFISSQSPFKVAGPDTDAGASRIQANIDALAQVFIDTVARNRNKNPEDAVEWSGQGAVFVAAEAMQMGLIDEIGTFESTLEAMKQERNSMDWNKLTTADLRQHRADLVAEIETGAVAGVPKLDEAAIRAEAAQAERERIAAIEAMEMPGTGELIAKFKADGTKPEVAALEIIRAAKAAPAQPVPATNGAQHLAALKQTEDGLQPPKAGSGEDAEPTLEEAAKAATALARKAGIDA